MKPLDFYLQFIQEIKQCSKCGEVLETMEQTEKHCIKHVEQDYERQTSL